MREIIISRNDLLEAINKTSVIANNKYKFLNLFWFHAGTGDSTKGTELTICTSNQQGIAIKYHAAADITNDTDNPIEFCLSACNIKKMLRLLPEQPLRLECHLSQLEIIHENGSFIIPYSEASDDYFKTPIKSPDIEAEIRHTIEIPDMRRYLDKTEAFMADDELRPVMSGILFKWVEENSHSAYSHLNVVASDGHALALVEAKHREMVPSHEIVLPRDTIKVLRRVLPKVGWIEIRWKKEKARRLSVIDSNRKVVMEIETNLVDGRYPNYPAVLPTTTNLTIKVDRLKLLASIKRLSLFANEKSNLVEFRLVGGNTISLKSGDYDYGTSSTEKVPAEYGVAPAICCHFGFRGQSVSKILSLIPTENVLIKMRDNTTGCLFTQDDTTDGDKLTYLIMPMMVD